MLHWFDLHTSAYWWLAWTAFALLLLLSLAALRPGDDRGPVGRLLRSDWLYSLALVAALFAFRWPLLLVEREFNPDESQLIAGALTLSGNPVFWDSVNGTTSGPLNFYALFLGRLLGLPFDYGAARLVGLGLVAAAIVSIYRLLARHQGAIARLGVLPVFAVFAFASLPDLVHYSSEHVPLALLALGLVGCGGVVSDSLPTNRWSWRNFTGALALGAAPLAKLQAGPIAAVILATVGVLYLCRPIEWAARRRRFLELGLGTLSPALFFALLTFANGVLLDAWRAYFEHNLLYSASRHLPLGEAITRFWDFTRATDSVHPYLLGAALFGAVAVLGLPAFRPVDRRLVALSGTAAAAAWVAVVFPGRQYGHYLLLLLGPAGLLVGALLGAWWQTSGANARARVLRASAAAIFVGACLVPQVVHRATHRHLFLGGLADASQRRPGEAGAAIRHYATAGELLGQWGWMPRLHVLTRLGHATREGHSELELCGSPMQEYFRGLYLAALERRPPPVFVDAVGPGNFVYTDRGLGHESFPALATLIRERYTLVADVEGCRIYVRNDRFAARPPLRTENVLR